MPTPSSSTILDNVFRGSSASDLSDCYFIGGYVDYASNFYECNDYIRKFNFTTEITTSIPTEIYTGESVADNDALMDWPTYDKVFIFGGKRFPSAGQSSLTTSNFTDNVMTYDVFEDVVASHTEIFFNVEGPMACQQIDKMWIAGGINKYSGNDVGEAFNIIQYVDKLTNTLAVKAAAKLVIPRGYGAASVNNERTKAYFAGGGDYNLYRSSVYETDIIEVFDFLTDVNCIKCSNNLRRDRVGLRGAHI